MTLHDIDYYSEHALDQRRLVMTAQREKTRRMREAFQRQYDAILGPKKPIRSILSIVAAKTSKSLS
jgi:hypothetical protein